MDTQPARRRPGPPRRTDDDRTVQVNVTLPRRQLALLEALRQPGESRSRALSRLLDQIVLAAAQPRGE